MVDLQLKMTTCNILLYLKHCVLLLVIVVVGESAGNGTRAILLDHSSVLEVIPEALFQQPLASTSSKLDGLLF